MKIVIPQILVERRIRRDLGYDPQVSLDDGLRRLKNWLAQSAERG